MKGHSVAPLWCHGGTSNTAQGKEQHAQALAGANAAPSAWAAACEVAVQLGFPDTSPPEEEGVEPVAAHKGNQDTSISSSVKISPAAPEVSARLGFNSLGAFASVNHLHLHIMYADHLGGEDNKHGGGGGIIDDERQQQQQHEKQVGFPVEHAPVARHLSDSRGVAVDLLAWPVPCFSFSSSAAAGTSSSNGSGDGDRNGQGDSESYRADAAVAAAAGALVEQLASEQIPYNVLFVPGSRPREGPDGRSSLRVIVFPRQPQECFDPRLEGFNAAVCEVSGLLVAFSPEAYANLNHGSVSSALAARVGLPAAELDRLCLAYKDWEL